MVFLLFHHSDSTHMIDFTGDIRAQSRKNEMHTGNFHSIKNLFFLLLFPYRCCADVLTSAAMEGNCSIFRRAIQSKVNLDMADSRSATPISVAVQYGQEEVVQMLLESPININLTMATGETLLMVAAQRVSSSFFSFLRCPLTCVIVVVLLCIHMNNIR